MQHVDPVRLYKKTRHGSEIKPRRRRDHPSIISIIIFIIIMRGTTSLLLLVLLVQSLLGTPVCTNQCCRFVESFPGRLRRLRQDYLHIRDFYEANDDLDTALLDQSVEESFRTPFACHTMNGILDFYLRTVLPTALAGVTEDTKGLKPHMESIQYIFDEMKREVNKCRKYFACQTQFDVINLNTTYNQLESKGVYKAMSELDVLFNYIETYLASKRHRSHFVSS